MKFVFFGYDFSLPIAQRLCEEGHELLNVYSFPCDERFNFNRQLRILAHRHNAPFSEERINEAAVKRLINKGAEVFVVAGYPFKVPEIDETRACGINIHPALLPRCRGIMPAPWIIMEEPQAAGITLHKLASKIDAGDILLQQAIKIGDDSDVEELSARCMMIAPDMAAQVLDDLPSYWQKAQKQDESKASSYSEPNETMRSLNWHEGVESVDRTYRAFGRFGALARIEGKTYAVYDLKTWAESHNYQPGHLVLALSREIVIAASDGFACLKDFEALG